jgi:hypothetical protein
MADDTPAKGWNFEDLEDYPRKEQIDRLFGKYVEAIFERKEREYRALQNVEAAEIRAMLKADTAELSSHGTVC